MSQKFTDENNNHAIDLSKAEWASDGMHEDYRLVLGTPLKDIDWVVQDKDGIILIEYKNYNKAVINRFNDEINGDELAQSVAKKFYDSFIFLLLNGKQCEYIRYVFIIERQGSDSTLRRKLRNKIARKLPFALQDKYGKTIINSFDVLDVAQWNKDQIYSAYPISIAT